MSARDQQLLTSLDLSYSEIAKISNKSRQTVSKFINSPRDEFFSKMTLMKVFDYKCREDESTCDLAKKVISGVFPEHSDLFSVGKEKLPATGEYWFAYKSCVEFEARYPECFLQLEKLAVRNGNIVVAFVPDSDYKTCDKLLTRICGNNEFFIYPCNDTVSLHIPVIVHKDEQGQVSAFVAGSTGFFPAGEPDANSLRVFLSGFQVVNKKF